MPQWESSEDDTIRIHWLKPEDWTAKEFESMAFFMQNCISDSAITDIRYDGDLQVFRITESLVGAPQL